MRGAIVAHTNRIAEELAARCSPSEELAAWVRLAEQREAMVVELYHPDAIARRIPGSLDSSVSRVVVKAIGSIWAQEVTHTTLLGSLRTVAEDDAVRTEALLGGLEGSLVGHATMQGMSGAMARCLIGIGRAFGGAPDFTRELAPIAFDAFCEFSHELEQTAAHGYSRMLSLIGELEARDERYEFGVWLRYEIAKTLAEERLHAAVLRHIESWLAADKARFLPRSSQRCVEELRELADVYLAVRRLEALTPELQSELGTSGERALESGSRWVSDGGLGDLFRDFGVEVPIHRPTGMGLGGGEPRAMEP